MKRFIVFAFIFGEGDMSRELDSITLIWGGYECTPPFHLPSKQGLPTGFLVEDSHKA
jgi:hypothetical protein